MLTLSHDDYMALVARYQSQRDTLTPEQVQLIEHGESTALSANSFAVKMGSQGGDGWNPTAPYKAQAQAAAEFSTVTMAANQAPKPVLSEKEKVRAMNHRDREAYRLGAGIPRHNFGNWLWGAEPRQPIPTSHPSAIEWAEQVLRGAA